MTSAAQPPAPLRVGVVVHSATGPRWVAALLDDLRRSRRFEIVVANVEAPAPAPRSRAFRLYERADAALFGQDADALAGVALPAAAPYEMVEACDVVLALAPPRTESYGTTPKFGVWELRHRSADGRPSEPMLYWETARRAVVETSVEAVLGGGRRLLYRSYGATDPASLRRGRNRALWKAKGALVRCLLALADRRDGYLESRPQLEQIPDRPPREPGVADVVSLAVRAWGGVVGRRLRRAFYDEPWFIGVRPRVELRAAEGLAPEPPFRRIDPPRGRAFADPFAFEARGRAYLFLEDYDVRERRAGISYIALDTAGAPLAGPEPALRREHHLSYPFVFNRDGEIFMIPESSADRRVTLYRAVDFPSKWVPERVLLDDLLAVDATLLEHEGRLWLFAAVAVPGASLDEELHLFSAAELSGPWEPHPENPVVADVRRARPAGRIFRDGADLIRPAQDCSRSYGRAIVLSRIDVLTQYEYGETPLSTIEPGWTEGLEATHTYSFTETLEVIDGRRRIRRPWTGLDLSGRTAGIRSKHRR